MTFQAAATLWHRTNVARYKGATAVKYENLLRSHILPELGARQLEEINTLLLADFMNAKLHCGRLDHSGGLSSSYVRSMMLLVLDIMEFAAAEGLCPPVKTTLQTPAANRREVVILDTDALRRLETYLLAKPDITGTGILISLHTGLRISEVCALRWEDIDFRKAVLHVRSTVARVRGTDGGTATRLIIDTPKTKSSLRDILKVSGTMEGDQTGEGTMNRQFIAFYHVTDENHVRFCVGLPKDDSSASYAALDAAMDTLIENLKKAA